MRTKLVFNPGDRVRHSDEFMREFERAHHAIPGSDEWNCIAHSEGRVMLDIGNGQYMVEWQYMTGIPEDERLYYWPASDMQPA